MKKAHPPLRQVFAANIKAEREKCGMSQQDLANAARLRHCRIDTLERGGNVSIDNIERLAATLKLDVVALFKRT